MQTTAPSNVVDALKLALKEPLEKFACPQLKDLKLEGEPFWKAAQRIYPGVKKGITAM